MRYSILQLSIAAVICIVIGCGLPAEPLRESITFDYTPSKEAAPGSANVTFAVVGAQPVTPTQQGVTQSLLQAPVPLFEDFASTMTKDFMEVLNARGFGVTGPFETYDKIMHPVKEASDLLLTAQVKFIAEMSGVQIAKRFTVFSSTRYYALQGSATVKCDVTLLLSECLTNEPMWTKSIAMEPFMVTLDSSSAAYSNHELAALATKYGQIQQHPLTGIPLEVFTTQVFPKCPIGVFLQKDNKFHADLGHALEAQYVKILNQIDVYLDPREIAIVKNQAMELRKRKVY